MNLKPTGKSSKHFDGSGMYLFHSATGGKLWRLVFETQLTRLSVSLRSLQPLTEGLNSILPNVGKR